MDWRERSRTRCKGKNVKGLITQIKTPEVFFYEYRSIEDVVQLSSVRNLWLKRFFIPMFLLMVPKIEFSNLFWINWKRIDSSCICCVDSKYVICFEVERFFGRRRTETVMLFSNFAHWKIGFFFPDNCCSKECFLSRFRWRFRICKFRSPAIIDCRDGSLHYWGEPKVKSPRLCSAI